MIEILRHVYLRLLHELDIETFRYLYHSFTLDDRMTGLIGPRGVGKTTLLLQFIKYRLPDPQEAFYFSADHIYFNRYSLWDFVRQLHEEEDIRFIFIDEIHKYRNWNQELKNLYDAFPNIKVVFSGSSSLNLIHGAYDLSRRAAVYHLPGFSFREYLNFATNSTLDPIDFGVIVKDPARVSAQLAGFPRLLGHFKAYLRQGYYPFAFETASHFSSRLNTVIDKTIYEDISNHYNLKTANLHYFKKILSFLATIPPGKINIHNLAGHLGIDSKTTLHYVHILEQTGLARLLYTGARGTKRIRSPEKVFCANTTLLQAICDALGQSPDIGATREIAFATALTDAGKQVYCKKKGGDFMVDGITFEVGGKNKTTKQVRDTQSPSFIVKDGVLTGGKKTIPLYLFGFLY